MALNYSSGSSNGCPDEAKPDSELAALPTPTEWVTVLGAALSQELDWGSASHLIHPTARQRTLADYSGEFGAGGSAGVSITYPDKRTVFEEGLEDSDSQAEFFVQRRSRHGLAEPTTENRPSFLSYFDESHAATDPGTTSTTPAGITSSHEYAEPSEGLRIDNAALPLRRYLAAWQRLLVVQLNRITRLDSVPSPRSRPTSPRPMQPTNLSPILHADHLFPPDSRSVESGCSRDHAVACF